MATSLHVLAHKACIKNIRSINDVGDIPYDTLKSILLKLESPEQLREIEKASPQICGADEEIWRAFIKRDVANWRKLLVEPKNPKSWYKVYRKLRIESQQQVDKDAETLKVAMEGIKSDQAKHTSKVIDPSLLPRLPATRGMRLEGGRSRYGPSHTGNMAILSFTSGSKTKTLTGKGVLDKARREARELSLFSARKALLATPTHKLSSKATQIHHVPQSLLEEHRRPPPTNYVVPGSKPTVIFAPRKRSTTGGGAPVGVTNEEKEKRLRAFTTPGNNRQGPEAASSTSSNQQNISMTFPSAQYNDQTRPHVSYSGPIPRLSSPNNKGHRLIKTKAPVDPFMPAKRRKIS